MTDEEADYWDEFFTKNPPKADPNRKGGYFTRQTAILNLPYNSRIYPCGAGSGAAKKLGEPASTAPAGPFVL
jgi:hypothetical protein